MERKLISLHNSLLDLISHTVNAIQIEFLYFDFLAPHQLELHYVCVFFKSLCECLHFQFYDHSP